MKILRNASLKKHLTFRIEARTEYFTGAKSRNAVIGAVQWAVEKDMPFMVLGGGSNLLFRRKFNGLIIRNAWPAIKHEKNGFVFVSSGAMMSSLVDFCIKKGLDGISWAGGLPGTAGGAVRGNAGAFGGEIKDSVVKVESLSIKGGSLRLVERSNKECLFSYRESVFKHNNEIILGIWLKLNSSDRKLIEKKTNECKAYREKFQPLDYPSAGSFFKNIPVESVNSGTKKKFSSVIKNDPFPLIPAAAVIYELGLKGKSIGGACLSEKHPNFIINLGNASFSDVNSLAGLVKRSAIKRFGIKMHQEVQFV